MAFEERVRRRKRKNEASNSNQPVLTDARSHLSGPSMVQSSTRASNVPGSLSLQIVPTSSRLNIGDTSQFPPLVHPLPESDVCQSSHASTGSSQWISSGPPVNIGPSTVQQGTYAPHMFVPNSQNNISGFSAIQPGVFKPPMSIQPGVHPVSSIHPGTSAVQLGPQCPPVYYSTSAIQPSIHASYLNQSVPRSIDVNIPIHPSTHHLALQQPGQVVTTGLQQTVQFVPASCNLLNGNDDVGHH